MKFRQSPTNPAAGSCIRLQAQLSRLQPAQKSLFRGPAGLAPSLSPLGAGSGVPPPSGAALPARSLPRAPAGGLPTGDLWPGGGQGRPAFRVAALRSCSARRSFSRFWCATSRRCCRVSFSA